MPYKLIGYLIKHAVTGLALSATAVLGFAYLIMVPGSELHLAAKLLNATQQLLQISHLLFPLVLLIGLSFGLGLLHNHSEIVQLTQIQSVRVSFALILATCMAFMALSERWLWPQLELHQPTEDQSNWQRKDDVYADLNGQAILIDQGHIVGYRSDRHSFGEAIPYTGQTLNRIESRTQSWLRPPASVKQQYAWWQQWHQALWPVPLFYLLWLLLNKRVRGSSAASLTGTIAGAAITSGLLAEAMNIVLNKALAPPWSTMVFPLFAVGLLTLILIWRHR